MWSFFNFDGRITVGNSDNQTTKGQINDPNPFKAIGPIKMPNYEKEFQFGHHGPWVKFSLHCIKITNYSGLLKMLKILSKLTKLVN